MMRSLNLVASELSERDLDLFSRLKFGMIVPDLGEVDYEE